MNAHPTTRLPAGLQTVAVLAELLQRLEAGPQAPSPEQYRTLVQRLAQALREADGEPLLPALLDGHPAAAEVYENLRYEQAGLCRSPLERSLNSELQARGLLQKVAAG